MPVTGMTFVSYILKQIVACIWKGQLVTNTGPIEYLPTDGDCVESGMFIGSEGTNGIYQVPVASSAES